MRKSLVILIVALMAIVAASAWAQDDAKTVTVTGEGVIFNNDQATAEAKAIEAALRQAVEQVVGVYISADTLVENYVTISDRILSKSQGYVQTYTKKKSEVKDGIVVVTLDVTVARAKLKGDLMELQAALAKKNFPRMMLLIGEQNIGEKGYSQWWGNTAAIINMGTVENTLIDVLGEKGFTFVDPDVLKGKVVQKDAYQIQSGNGLTSKAAREIANLTDAQVVITGTAVAVDAGKLMGTDLHSGQADITVRAINTDNGEILFSASAKATVSNVNPVRAGKLALEKASKSLADEIVRKITKKWLQMQQTITIEVAGLASYQMLDDFKAALAAQIAGVQAVMVRKMNKDKAQLDIVASSAAELIAKDLAQKSFTGFLVRVDGVSANQLKVTLIKQ